MPSQHSKAQLVAATALMAIAGSALLLAGACSNTDQPSRNAAEPPHAVHSAELRQAMTTLSRHSREDLSAEIYAGNVSRSETDDLAAAADDIAATADHIPSLVAHQTMSESDRSRFEALAHQLGTRAREVSAAAKSGHMPEVRVAIDRLNQTCSACHSEFRIPGG